jgi:hypothetical protein
MAPARRDLTHPIPLLAILLLVANDHLLKGSGLLPGRLTGKLSDVAGLFFFPLLLVSILDPVAPQRVRGRPLALGCAAATGLVFAALKLSPQANALAARWGTFALDPTDLLALPALGLALLFLEARAPSTPAPRWFQAGTVLAAAAASLASPAPRYPRAYPRWQLVNPAEQTFACARVWPFVARSGKQGIGVGVEVLGEDCEVRASARLRVGAQVFAMEGVEPSVEATSRPRYLYLPIPFDNNASWNRGEREGELELTITAGSERRISRILLRHRFDCFYESGYRQRPLRTPGGPLQGAETSPFAAPPPGASTTEEDREDCPEVVP